MHKKFLNSDGIVGIKIISLAAFLLLVTISVGTFASRWLENYAKEQLIKENRAAIASLTQSLSKELQKYEDAVTSLAGSPAIVASLSLDQPENISQANIVLDRYHRSFKAAVCYLMDLNGITIASSNRNSPASFVGKNYKFRPYFQKALKGGHGHYFALGVTSRKRGYYASFPVRNMNREIVGVAVIKIELDGMAKDFGNFDYAFLIDPNGVIFISSHRKLVLNSLWPITAQAKQELAASKQFGTDTFETLMPAPLSGQQQIKFQGKSYFVFQEHINQDKWSLVIFSLAQRVVLYKSLGILGTILIVILILTFSGIAYFIEFSSFQVKRNERRFQQIAHASKDWIWEMDKKGRYTYSNETAKKSIGYDPKEIVGKHYYDFFDEKEKSYLTEKAKNAFGQKKEFSGIPLRHRHKNGDIIYHETTGIPLFDENGSLTGYSGIHRDITEHKKAEKARDMSEQTYREIFEKSVNAIIIHDIVSGKIIDFNIVATEMMGYSAEEFRHLDIGAMSSNEPPYTQTEALAWIKKAYTDGPQLIEWRSKNKSGRVFWTEVSLKSAIIAGQHRVLAMIRDISERKQFDEKLQANLNELKKFQASTIDRELKMIELKKTINELSSQLGQPPPYSSDELS